MIKKASHTYGLVNLNLFKVFAQLVHIIILILNLTQVHRSSSNKASLLADPVAYNQQFTLVWRIQLMIIKC